MAKISVIVPVYKVEPYLCRCVDSILAQTFKDFELILVDDGSPDRCGEICDEYAKQDSRVVVIHRRNGGLSAARNSGLEWMFENSDSEWITFVDSDDWVEQSMLADLLSGVERTGAEVSVCSHSRERVMKSCDEFHDEVNYKVMTPEEFWVWCHDECHTGIFTSNVAWGKLYDRKLFQSVRYPEEVMAHEDVFTTYKVLFRSKKIAVTNARLYNYFVNVDSITGNCWKPSHINAIRGEMQQIVYFEDHGLDRALRAAANWHFARLEWDLSNARNSKEGQAVVAELESLIKVRYDRYWRMAGERVDWYFLAKIAHPFSARICYPFYRVSSAVRRNGLKGSVRKLIARIGGR